MSFNTYKKKIKYLFLIIVIVTMGCIGYISVTKVLDSSLTAKNNQLKQIQLLEEVLNSDDPIIQILVKKLKYYPKINNILANLNLYPRELLKLASEKNEVIDFVANYPNYKSHTVETISTKTEYKKGEIPLFIQWDERWGYEKYGLDFIAINGCGPTSLAMVAVGLTGDTSINPKVVADFSLESGHLIDGIGSSWTLMTEGAKNFGLNGRELPLSKSAILNTLKKGQPIIASMGPGEFTSKGHYIVLTGVDKNNKIIVNDSDSKIRSKKTWEVDIFMKETKNLWTFTSMV